ncbi:MAG: zinc ABC transporter substrate-binding protein [Candidatus Sumerlaeia bacterium]|nr:zinc ABC transporter substrate-binding protein [Candidatus Sumerlaeia bacterium]
MRFFPPFTFILPVLTGLTLLMISGCSKGAAKESQGDEEKKVSYVASIQPLALILGELTAGRANVSLLLDPAASPHTYDPRPSDIRKVSQADALIYVDESLDGWAARIQGAKRIAVFPLLPEAFRLHFDGDGHICDGHHHGHHHHHHSVEDAHFWTDPIAIREILLPLAEKLGEVDPDGREIYHANALLMSSALDELHDEIGIELMDVMGRSCVLFHPSFNYMFHRFGIESAAVVEPSPGQESSPAWLRGIIETMKEENVRVIFTEPQLSPRPAQILAEASGVRLREIDPLGVRGNPQTIGDFLRYNTSILREALE